MIVKISITCFLLMYTFVLNGQIRQYGLGKWTLSTRYSVDVFDRKLKDNPRSSIDSIWGMSDSAYIMLRNSHDNKFVGYTIGLSADYRIKPGLWFNTGFNYVRAGSKVYLGNVTDENFISVFEDFAFNDTVYTNYNFIEIPLMFKTKIAPKVRYEKSMTGNRFLTLRRILYAGLGVSVKYSAKKYSNYNRVELIDYDPSVGIAGIGTVGINQLFRYRIRLDAGLNFRYSLTTMYPYAPIQSKYSSIGANISLGYTFKYKSPKQKKKIDLSCRNFISIPQPTDYVKLQYGLLFGIGQSSILGEDSESSTMLYRGQVAGLMSSYNSSEITTFPVYGPHLGFNIEYFFAPEMASIGAVFMYNQKGYMIRGEFQGTNNSLEPIVLNSQARTIMDNFDIHGNIKIMPVPHIYFFAGGVISLPLNEEVYNYYQIIEEGGIEPSISNTKHYGSEDSENYWPEPRNLFTYGPAVGIGAELDNYLDIYLSYQRHSSLFDKGFDVRNQGIQLSVMYTLFNRKIFEED